MAKIEFDPSDAGLREVVRHELTRVTGTLDYRIDHLLQALKARAMMIEAWNNQIEKNKGRKNGKLS